MPDIINSSNPSFIISPSTIDIKSSQRQQIHMEFCADGMLDTSSFNFYPSTVGSDAFTIRLPRLTEKQEIDMFLLKEANRLYAITQDDTIESGQNCATELYFKEKLESVGNMVTMAIASKFFEAYCDQAFAMTALIHALSHFNYSDVSPNGSIIATALLQNESLTVREFALKAFENWSSKTFLPVLRGLHCDQEWMQDYVNIIISEIEGS